MALYRKWRPQLFSDIAGQEHIKTTLVNALKHDRLTHAYLFTGPRGTGKTTMARLLAKAVNCERRQTGSKKTKPPEWSGEPCNKCHSCLEISRGQSLDVIEIDAASNRGIEEIRELREKVKFAPGSSRFKVFIIDEVHMLTREAFNALLKTLEEPPKHAIFILATTEPHKVPATILSRCQRYDFRRGRHSEIKQHLEKVSQGERLILNEEAVNLIGRLAEGSFRDALSLLDQVASTAKDRHLSPKEVRTILGLADEVMIRDFLGVIGMGNIQEGMNRLQTIVNNGVDMAYFTNSLIEAMRLIMLIKSGLDQQIISLEWSEDEWGEWLSISEKFSTDEALGLLKGLIEASKEIKRAPLPQLPLEIAILHWYQSRPKTEGGIDQSEKPIKMQDLKRVETATQITSAPVDSVGQPEDKTESTRLPIDQKLWQTILQKIRPFNHSLYALLKDAVPIGIEDDRVLLGVRFRFHAERLYDKKNRPVIEQIFTDVLDKPRRLECQIDENMPKPPSVVENELIESVVENFGVEE